MTAADRHAPDAHADERETIVRVLESLGFEVDIDIEGGQPNGRGVIEETWNREWFTEDRETHHRQLITIRGPRLEGGSKNRQPDPDALDAALDAAGVRGPEAVARIEGERDELLREVDHLRSTFFASCPKSHEHGIWCGSDWVSLKHRAERAEARLAAVERLPNTGAPDEIEELWIRVSDLQAALRGDT